MRIHVFSDREHGEDLFSVATVGHVLRSMVKLEAENDMGSRVSND
jgi:hypothetical protein